MFGQSSGTSPISLIKSGLLPQEEMLEIGIKKKKLSIGFPKESIADEFRVAITPEAVENIVTIGHDVFLEKGIGVNANYADIEYSERGGIFVDERAEIFKADIIVKINPLTIDEIDLLTGRQIVMSYLLLYNQKKEYFDRLLEKKVTAISFEHIKDEYDCHPIVQSMSAISGNVAVIIAAEYLSISQKGKGVLLGGIPGITPAEVIILGADTAAEYAIRAAMGLGVSVRVFDNSVQKLRLLQDKLGSFLNTSIFHPKILRKSLKSADVVIGTVYLDESQPYLITEDMVKEMKPGSIIIDTTIEQGGCIETSEYRGHKNPTFVKHGVVHYGVPNLPTKVARTASIALSNVIFPLLMSIGELGGIKQQLLVDHGFRNGVYLYNGILTKAHISQLFGIPSKDIDLLMAAF